MRAVQMGEPSRVCHRTQQQPQSGKRAYPGQSPLARAVGLDRRRALPRWAPTMTTGARWWLPSPPPPPSRWGRLRTLD